MVFTERQRARKGLEVRRDFTEWCRFAGFEPAEHHRIVIRELDRVARGEIDRLALFLPPGSAKSTYASILFPPWFMAQRPSHSIIAASHTAELAERFGRRVRNLLTEHSGILGVGVSQRSSAAGRWDNNRGGEYFAAGVGGSITGRRADLAIIDDPIRSREDADSKLIRDKQWDWYKFDLLTRLKPNAGIVLIQTRWHSDDLAGRILAEEGDRWNIVSLPMEATSNDDPLGRSLGEPLWPEWFNDQMRSDARRDPRVWQSLYQQSPVAEEGSLFKREWVHVVDHLPPKDTMRFYGGSDYAVTSDGGDYTAHVVIGVDPENNLYLVDLWRKQASSDQWVDAWCDLVLKWRPFGWAEETGQIKSGVGPFLERRAVERRAFTVREVFPTRGDKAVRAQSIRGRMAMGGLRILRGSPWLTDFVNELAAFPTGVHDDMVDALGLVGQLMDKFVPGIPQDKPKGPFYRDYGSRQDDSEDYNWRVV